MVFGSSIFIHFWRIFFCHIPKRKSLAFMFFNQTWLVWLLIKCAVDAIFPLLFWYFGDNFSSNLIVKIECKVVRSSFKFWLIFSLDRFSVHFQLHLGCNKLIHRLYLLEYLDFSLIQCTSLYLSVPLGTSLEILSGVFMVAFGWINFSRLVSRRKGVFRLFPRCEI